MFKKIATHEVFSRKRAYLADFSCMNGIQITKIALVLFVLVNAQTALSYEKSTKFQTLESLEPDIWGSIWLISKLSDGDGNVLVESTPRNKSHYVSFGFDGADVFLPGGSHFNYLLDEFDVDDPALSELGELVSSVERLGWQSKNNKEVSQFEYEFRSMQEKFGRYWVPVGCYKNFFDKEYARLAGTPFTATDAECSEDYLAGNVSRPSIPMTAIEHVLFEIENGKNVVFVDTREPSEYEERHIPGAISLPFRHIDSIDSSVLADADMVIPYCIKDFRGFEAARRLQENGISHVTLLDPFGLAGWVEKELPMSGTEALSEEEGQAQLAECVKTRCLSKDKAAL